MMQKKLGDGSDQSVHELNIPDYVTKNLGKTVEKTSEQDKLKMWAAASLALQSVTKDTKVIGLGSGRTILFFTAALGRRLEELGLSADDVTLLSTSKKTTDVATSAHLKITRLCDYQKPSKGEVLYVDGVDKVSSDGRAIKGGGRAAFSEKKLLKAIGGTFIAIADEKKIVDFDSFPLPIVLEQLPDDKMLRSISSLLNPSNGKTLEFQTWEQGGETQQTEQGHYIVDVSGHDLSNLTLPEIQQMERKLDDLPGVTASGIFACDATRPKIIIIGKDHGADYYGENHPQLPSQKKL